MLQDLFIDMPFSHELGMNILVTLQLLPCEKPVLIEAIAYWRHVIFTAAGDAAGRDMHQTCFVLFTPDSNILYRPDVCSLYLIALCKVLDAGGTVNDSHAFSRSTEGKQCI